MPDVFRPTRQVERLARQPFDPFERRQVVIPICAAGKANVRAGPNADLTVKRPSRYDSYAVARLRKRKRGAAFRTKALYVTCSGKPEALDIVLTRQPCDLRRRRKQICRMSRTAISTAARAVAKKEAFKRSRYAELHSAAKAPTGRWTIHAHTPRYSTTPSSSGHPFPYGRTELWSTQAQGDHSLLHKKAEPRADMAALDSNPLANATS